MPVFLDPRAEARRIAACERAARWRAANRERDLENKRKWSAARPKKGRMKNETHHQWKGEHVGYHALHIWITRHKGRPSKCEQCGTQSAKRFEWANVDHKYSRNLEDYKRMCTSCHRRHDYANGLSEIGGPHRKRMVS